MRGPARDLARRVYREAWGLLPFAWQKQGAEYEKTARFLEEAETWSAERQQEHQSQAFLELLDHCARTVPYYRRVFAEQGVNLPQIRSTAHLRRLPFLDKDTVRACFDELHSEVIPRENWQHRSTGGTSGKPLVFHIERGVSQEREWAFMHHLWARVGFQPGARTAALRNTPLPGESLHDWNARTRTLLLSPYRLTLDTVWDYLEEIGRHHIRFLHTYPSAAVNLLRLALEAGIRIELPLRAVLASSENVYPGQREFVEHGLKVRFFSWYGHSEQGVLAGECEVSQHYHPFPSYGVLELIDAEGRVITEPGVQGEIVTTGFNNRVMPFIRYRTGDLAEYVAGPCACGRPVPLLTRVSGLWRDMEAVTRDGARVSMTALNMHTACFDHVRQYQFVQEEPGKLVLFVVPASSYGPGDRDAITRELGEKLGEGMHLVLEEVEEIRRTDAGKWRFLIQKLPASGGEA